MRFFLFFCLYFLSFESVFSQKADTGTYYFTGVQAHYGFIIPHSSAIEPVSHTNPYGFEFSLNRIKTFYESWSVFNNYNISGVTAGYFNFHNPDVLGAAYTLTIFTEPVFRFNDNYFFSVRAGTGLSYMSKVYDEDENPTNRFFSTKISIPLCLSARFKYRLNPDTYFTVSVNYNHISNGAIKIPNFGMNFPTISAGLEAESLQLTDLHKGYIKVGHKKISDNFILFQSLAGYKVVYGEPTFAYGFSARFARQLRTRYGLNAGAELMLDGGVKRMTEIEELDIDYKRFAVTFGQDLLLGKIVFTQYFGFYLYSPYAGKNPFYQKYELMYRIFPDFLTGVYLKAYGSDAELCGICFDYILHLQKH